MSIESVLVSELLKEFLTEWTCVYLQLQSLVQCFRKILTTDAQDSSFALFKKANDNETDENMQYIGRRNN